MLTGCAGWSEKSDIYRARRGHGEASYQFGRPPQGWTPVRAVEGVQVAWVNESLSGTGIIELHAQCDEQGDSSLAQYTDHLRLDWDDWSIVEQSESELVGRAALQTVVDASLDGIPRRHELWVVKKNGCLFDLRYSAGLPDFSRGQPHFKAVVRGFSFPV